MCNLGIINFLFGLFILNGFLKSDDKLQKQWMCNLGIIIFTQNLLVKFGFI